jgi:hypothetical protein
VAHPGGASDFNHLSRERAKAAKRLWSVTRSYPLCRTKNFAMIGLLAQKIVKKNIPVHLIRRPGDISLKTVARRRFSSTTLNLATKIRKFSCLRFADPNYFLRERQRFTGSKLGRII